MSTRKPVEKSTLTREEAAARSGLSVRTIDRMIAKGELPAWKHARAIRIDARAFEEYMNAHRVVTSPVHTLRAMNG